MVPSNTTVQDLDLDAAPFNQYQHLLGQPEQFIKEIHSKDNIPYFLDQRKYTLSYRIVNQTILTITIKEEWLEDLSPGGSNFYIVQDYFTKNKDHMRTLCEYRDFYNGTYTVYCPMYSDCVAVSVEVHVHHYQGFTKSGPLFVRRRVKPNMRRIWFHRLCSKDYDSSQNVPKYSWKLKSINNTDHCSSLYQKEQPVKLYQSNELCKCLKKYEYVVSIGNSHTSYFTRQIKDYCQDIKVSWSVKGFVVPEDVGTMHTHWARYANETSLALNVTLSRVKDRCQDERCLVWLQFGSWPLAYSPIYEVMSQAQMFIDQVKAFDNATKDLNVDVVVMSSMSQPDTQQTSNFLTSVFNHKIRTELEQIGVRYVNLHSTVFMCFNDTPKHHKTTKENRNHYLLYDGVVGEYTGDVGRNAYLGQFMGTICGLL